MSLNVFNEERFWGARRTLASDLALITKAPDELDMRPLSTSFRVDRRQILVRDKEVSA
jgi:hypothetical protein